MDINLETHVMSSSTGGAKSLSFFTKISKLVWKMLLKILFKHAAIQKE